MSRQPRRLSYAQGLGLFLITVVAVAAAPRAEDHGYAGSRSCAPCHATEVEAWIGSHHDLAMTEVSEQTVLGDFTDAELTAHGVTSRFFRRDGEWVVHTEGPDGVLHDYRIDYTFGWMPLQQYLIELDNGHIQVLGLAWDSRPAEQGGQRWFHLYPDEPAMGPTHPLHWTARDQTWNYQCADCHSTGVAKGYDPDDDSYRTIWAAIDVACEACHGPAGGHVAEAEAIAAGEIPRWSKNKGLALDLIDRDGGRWLVASETSLPRRSVPRTRHQEMEVCARCHSRRSQIHARPDPRAPFSDGYQLALLEPGLYHADGQIHDEVFVYGSFLQSRMYRAGVTCTDCHDPHSLALKGDGDAVCARCHPAQRYAVASHHHHEPDGPGANCINCHMPQRTYMVIDERADHSLRIPRPDLTLALGTPNACNDCHLERSPHWAQATLVDWYGSQIADRPHFANALHAGRSAKAQAPLELLALATDSTQPGIARATALQLLRDQPLPSQLTAMPALLEDADPLIRHAAVQWLETTGPEVRFRLGMPLLADPIRSVRLEAARILAPLLQYDLSAAQHRRLEAALDDYVAAQKVNAERPEAQLSIGLVELARGHERQARSAYQQALRLDPHFAPAYVNLADLYRKQGADAEAEKTLRAGLERIPEDADLLHSLGLLQVRTNRIDEALASLRRAAEQSPDNPHYAYVYALALQEQGKATQAATVLMDAYRAAPANRDILITLVNQYQRMGDLDTARRFARELTQHWPQDPQAIALAAELDL